MKITITVSDDGIYRGEFYPSDEEDLNNSNGIESDSIIPIVQQLLKEFNVPLSDLTDENCDDCDNNGWINSCDEDGNDEIQRCDTCKTFKDDEEAREFVGKIEDNTDPYDQWNAYEKKEFTDGSREYLEDKHGQVWDTKELQKDFLVKGFASPVVLVNRKSDGVEGTLEFQHQPRFYFGFIEAGSSNA